MLPFLLRFSIFYKIAFSPATGCFANYKEMRRGVPQYRGATLTHAVEAP